MMQTDHRTRAISVLLILLIATAACRKHPSALEYEALSAFIDNKFASRKGVQPIEPIGNGITRIVILNTTESDEDGSNVRLDENGERIPWPQTASSLQSKVPALKRTTIDAFRESNRQHASLRRNFHPAFGYELVDSAHVDSFFKKGGGGWLAFYKQYPGSAGIMVFSRVGFSADGTQALFYLSNHCGELCGAGLYVVMEKRNGNWIIAQEIETWIS